MKGGPLKPDFGLSGAVLQLDRVFMVLFERLRYLHRNPVKRGLVASPELWRWSSFRAYFLGEA